MPCLYTPLNAKQTCQCSSFLSQFGRVGKMIRKYLIKNAGEDSAKRNRFGPHARWNMVRKKNSSLMLSELISSAATEKLSGLDWKMDGAKHRVKKA